MKQIPRKASSSLFSRARPLPAGPDVWGSETSSCLRSIVHVLLLLMFKPIEAVIKMYIVFSHVTPTTS